MRIRNVAVVLNGGDDRGGETEINSKFEHSKNVFGNKSKGKREKKPPK